MSIERRIEFIYEGKNETFLGTLEGLYENYPGAHVKKIEYLHKEATGTWRDLPNFPGYSISNAKRVRRNSHRIKKGMGYSDVLPKIVVEYTYGRVRLKNSLGQWKDIKISKLFAQVWGK